MLALRTALIASVLSLLAGCAGRDFVRPTSETFRLGQTTYAEVIQKMGPPRRTGVALKNEKNVRAISYAYAATGGEPLEKGVVPARAQVYYFHNDSLVGQEFLSSFKSDNSNFDETKISAISKGKTTRTEVIQFLGRPSDTFVAPMVKETSGEAFGYGYQATRRGSFGGFKFNSKTLRIAFDDNDKVSDVDYASSDTK